jgi:hypothetical protein
MRVVLQFIPIYESTICILSYQLKLLLFIVHLHIEVSLLLLKIYNLFMDKHKLFRKSRIYSQSKMCARGLKSTEILGYVLSMISHQFIFL